MGSLAVSTDRSFSQCYISGTMHTRVLLSFCQMVRVRKAATTQILSFFLSTFQENGLSRLTISNKKLLNSVV